MLKGYCIDEYEVPGDQGLNDFGKIAYGGPCPPSGMHRYYFNVYAVDDVVILEKPSFYSSVSQGYEDFDDLTDEEALAFIDKWEKEFPSHTARSRLME